MILLSTGSVFLYGLERVFRLAAEAGFAGVEVVIDQRADTWQPEYLERLAAECGLKVAALHSPFHVGLPGWPADAGARIARTVALAERIQAEVVVIHLPLRWQISVLSGQKSRGRLPHFWRRNREEIAWFTEQLPALQAVTDVKIAVEIMPLHRLMGWPVNAYVWNTLAEWPRFAHLTLDTTHCGTWGVDPCVVYDRANGRVSHIHLSNYDGQEHILPQRGDLALGRFLRHITAAGYAGHVSIETSPEAMEIADEDRVRRNLADSLAFCQEHLGS